MDKIYVEKIKRFVNESTSIGVSKDYEIEVLKEICKDIDSVLKMEDVDVLVMCDALIVVLNNLQTDILEKQRENRIREIKFDITKTDEFDFDDFEEDEE